jgi:hypothetical protein
LDLPDNCGWSEDLADYTNIPGGYEIGDILLVPTYRLEEVEEIIEPEKPGVPVEPYVGMVLYHNEGCSSCVIVAQVQSDAWMVAWWGEDCPIEINSALYFNDLLFKRKDYPHTPSTPAVTRKVKKWVKIEHPEVSSDGIA